MIKHTAFMLSTLLASGTLLTSARADEPLTVSASGVSETRSHIEKSLVEIGKSDFNAAQVHLKAARTSSEKIAGNEAGVKKANVWVIQGQIQPKLGKIKTASDQLNKTLERYKSL